MMSSKLRGHRCVVCRRNKSNCNSLKLHRFPKDVNRCLKWVNALNLPFLRHVSPLQLNNSYVVCSDHFEDNQYLSGRENGRLLHTSVPVKRLVAVYTESSDDETSDMEHEGPMMPKEEVPDKALLRFPDLNLYRGEDWAFNDYFPPSYYDESETISDEVRVGPSFSNCDIDLRSKQETIVPRNDGCSDQRPSPCGKIDTGQTQYSPDRESSEMSMENDANFDNYTTTSDAEACDVIDSTLKCVVVDHSLKLVKKDGTVFTAPKEKASHVPNALVSSFLQKRLKEATSCKEVSKVHNQRKMFALATHSKNPKSYEFMRHLFSLPSIEVLKEWKNNFTCDNGVCNSDVLSVLEKRALTMNVEGKLCGIVFHVFQICSGVESKVQMQCERDSNQSRTKKWRKSDATDFSEGESVSYALAVMVQGLNKNWKYLLGFHLLDNNVDADPVKEMLEACVVKLQGIRFIVKFVLCNYDSLNQSVRDLLGVTAEKPCFSVGGERVYFYCDSESLIVNTLKEFKRSNICVGSNFAKWKYVHRFLEKDSQQELKIGPQLGSLLDSLDSGELPNSQSKVAAQVFSQAVSSGIYMHTTAGVLSKDAVHTAEFIYSFSRLLDCFCSSKPQTNKIKAKRRFLDQIEFLKDLQSNISTWKYVSKSRERPKGERIQGDNDCLSSWQVNVNSLLQMWTELQDEHKIAQINVQKVSVNYLRDLVFANRKDNANRTKLTLPEFELSMCNMISKSLMQTSHFEDFESYHGSNGIKIE